MSLVYTDAVSAFVVTGTLKSSSTERRPQWSARCSRQTDARKIQRKSSICCKRPNFILQNTITLFPLNVLLLSYFFSNSSFSDPSAPGGTKWERNAPVPEEVRNLIRSIRSYSSRSCAWALCRLKTRTNTLSIIVENIYLMISNNTRKYI